LHYSFARSQSHQREPQGIPDSQRRVSYRRAAPLEEQDALSYTITIDDPKIFTAPWSQEFEILAKPEWDEQGLFEYV
jgi:hypothetical protein